MTLLLIAANMLAAFYLLVNPQLIGELGFRADHPSLESAIASLFLHQNLVHLLGNMVFLAAVGAAVEMASGAFRFATVFFVSGLLGVMAHMLVTGAPSVPLVGASGGVAGCAAYYSARYINMKVPLAPRVSVSVAFVTGLWVLLQILGAVIHFGSSSPVSYWSHIGGFAAGLMLSIAFRAPDLGDREQGHALMERMRRRSPAATIAACKHHLASDPHDTKALRQLAEAAATIEDKDEETDAIVRLIALSPEHAQSSMWTRLAELGELGRFPALQRMMLAERFKETEPALGEALLMSVVSEPVDEPQRPEAMLALAGLKIEDEPQQAERILSQLAATYPLHPAVELARRRGWIR